MTILKPLVSASLIAPGVAWSADSGTAAMPTHSSHIVSVLFALGAVTLAIIALAWVVKRLGNTSFLQQPGMKVISSLPMGTREKIVLVEVENQKLLLGVTSHAISSLHAFDKTADIKACENDIDAVDQPSQAHEKWDFSRHLKKIIGEGQRE